MTEEQQAAGSANVIIDCLSVHDDMNILQPLFADPRVVKVALFLATGPAMVEIFRAASSRRLLPAGAARRGQRRALAAARFSHLPGQRL